MSIIHILMTHQGSDRTGLKKEELKPVVCLSSSNGLVFLQGMMRPILKAS